LHAILLGHGTCLLNAFARLEKEQKEQKEKKKKNDGEEEEEQDTEEEDEEKPSEKKKRKYFVFTGDFGKQVFTVMLNVGYWLGQQSDPDKTRTHFCSGYLPKAGKGDDNTTGKKQAHEMRGVLLTILLLASSSLQRTVRQIGGDVLAKFVHIFVQRILMEDWLGKEQKRQNEKNDEEEDEEEDVEEDDEEKPAEKKKRKNFVTLYTRAMENMSGFLLSSYTFIYDVCNKIK